MEGQEKAGPGLVPTASADYSTTEGTTRRDVHTDEYVMKSDDGKRITKTVTEERITRFHDSLSPSQAQGGLSPSQAQGGLSPAQSQSSLYGLSTSTSQTSVLSGEHLGRSPNRSPVMWKPPSLSPAADRSNMLQEKTRSYKPNINISIESANVSSAPIAKPSKLLKPTKTVTVKETITVDKPAKSEETKENEDPIKMSEMAKWEARQGPTTVPKFKLENFGCNTFPRSVGRRKQSLERVDDPRYPMFEVYKPDWRAPFETAPPAPQPPAVPPKPLSPAPSPTYPEANNPSAHVHFPGMIRPPAKNFDILQLQPPPPPPPMPPAQGPPPTAPKPKKFRPGHASTPKHRAPEVEEHHHSPDHLPVFAPRVYFAPEDDSGFPGSPTRSDPMPFGEEHSDVSSLGMASRSKLKLWY